MRARLLIFWDYDSHWGAERSRLPGGLKDWGKLEEPCTDRLLEVHSRFEIPACFAVVGSVALAGATANGPAQIRRIHQLGHEVASHSHRHEWLPALGRAALLETLRSSKAALEDCIGHGVHAFVPPFNQPFDYFAGGSISLAERREAGRTRTNLRQLCDALAETGYRFCRVAYRPMTQRLAEWWAGARIDRPSCVENIRGVRCLRLNTGGGFDAAVVRMLDRCVEIGGSVIAYGHPHSLHAGGNQDERWLLPFLERVNIHRRNGRLDVLLPSHLVAK